MRFAAHAAHQSCDRKVPVNDLIGPASIAYGTPFCGMPIKLDATYRIAARGGKGSTRSKFGGKVTVDEGRIYRANPGNTFSTCKTVSLGMSAPVMAFGRCRSLFRAGFL